KSIKGICPASYRFCKVCYRELNILTRKFAIAAFFKVVVIIRLVINLSISRVALPSSAAMILLMTTPLIVLA
ncbi:hypothetical protein, partial [Vibrio parahaemolyticus]|uniref:hypothetical protein n=1 Tax=Vibrio parahaemolyticus TaxID=670 RepID=UPI001BB06602